MPAEDSVAFEISTLIGNKKSFELVVPKADRKFYDMLKDRCDASGKVFGVDLDTLMLREDTLDGIPAIVRRTVECLRAGMFGEMWFQLSISLIIVIIERARKEGIFRVEGPASQITALKDKYNQQGSLSILLSIFFSQCY